jgi:hypothetical protein
MGKKRSEEESMRRMILQGVVLTFMAALFLAPSINAAAQQASTEKGEKEVKEMKQAAATKPVVAVYRVDYTIREMEDGKVLNSRKYTLMAKEGGDWARSRVGSRVSVPTGKETFQVQNVGMNIDCAVHEQGETILLDSRIESSNLAPPGAGESTDSNPILRQVSSNVTAAVSLGKPAIIASLDDVTSNHRFEIEVTVTKVK